MNKKININAGLMLLVSVLFTYLTALLISHGHGSQAYSWGFIFGRALSSVLFPLFIVWLVRLVFRRKPMFTKGALISWWILFVLISFMGLFGSMLPAEV